jgi:hypothetical protein
MKRDIRKKLQTTIEGYDLRSTLEKVLEILNDIRDCIDMNDEKMLQDMNYCIKMISSNKLYDAELDLNDNDDIENAGPPGTQKKGVKS